MTGNARALEPAATGPSNDAVAPVTLPSTPRRRSDVLELDLGDGLIVYDDHSSLVHHLNPSASLIWRLCDGAAGVEDLANDIADEYGLDRGTVGEQVVSAISQLATLGLVEGGSGERAADPPEVA